MECELLRSPMISYRSLLYNTTVLYDIYTVPLDLNFTNARVQKATARNIHSNAPE